MSEKLRYICHYANSISIAATLSNFVFGLDGDEKKLNEKRKTLENVLLGTGREVNEANSLEVKRE